MRLTIPERIAAFKRAFPDHAAAWPWLVQEGERRTAHDVLYAVWVTGADYRTRADFYGAFPHRFLPYLLALFPDVRLSEMLHAFSGSMKPGPYTRLDLNPENTPDVVGNVYDAAALFPDRRFKLTIADPPYSAADAEKYGTPSVNQLRATTALAQVIEPRGHLAWLDMSWPMHSKRSLMTVGRIYLQRSTMHRTRVCHLFERAT